MKKILFVFLITMLLPNIGFSNCYVDYKAKKNNPLRLHYGISKINTDLCENRNAITLDLESRLQSSGWILLKLLDVFGNEGIDERKDSAGIYFLKY